MLWRSGPARPCQPADSTRSGAIAEAGPHCRQNGQSSFFSADSRALRSKPFTEEQRSIIFTKAHSEAKSSSWESAQRSIHIVDSTTTKGFRLSCLPGWCVFRQPHPAASETQGANAPLFLGQVAGGAPVSLKASTGFSAFFCGICRDSRVSNARRLWSSALHPSGNQP